MAERAKLEFIQPRWLRAHTFSEAGNALLHDLEEEVRHYDWVRTDEERRQLVLRSLVELGSQLLTTATREIGQDARDRDHLINPLRTITLAPAEPSTTA